MGATKASPVKLPTQQTPWRPGGGLPGSTAQLGLGPGGCKHQGGGHTSKEPSALGFPAQRPRRSGRPPPVRGREPVTPLVPSHDSLVEGLLSESPRGKQTLAGGKATSTPNNRRCQPRPPPALSSDQAAPPSWAQLSDVCRTPERTLCGLSSSSTCEITAGGTKGLKAGSFVLDAGCSFTRIDCRAQHKQVIHGPRQVPWGRAGGHKHLTVTRQTTGSERPHFHTDGEAAGRERASLGLNPNCLTNCGVGQNG